MNVNRTRKWTGLLLSGAVLSSLLVTSSLAAESSASLEFQYPEDVNPAEVTITVHEGYPTASGLSGISISRGCEPGGSHHHGARGLSHRQRRGCSDRPAPGIPKF